MFTRLHATVQCIIELVHTSFKSHSRAAELHLELCNPYHPGQVGEPQTMSQDMLVTLQFRTLAVAIPSLVNRFKRRISPTHAESSLTCISYLCT